MHAVLLSNSGLRLISPIPFPAKSSFQGKKIADFSLRLNSCKGVIQWTNSSNIRSEGSRSALPQRRVPSDKLDEGGENDDLKRKSKASGNEEILALFRRIKSSISKGGERKTPRRRRKIEGSKEASRQRRNGSDIDTLEDLRLPIMLPSSVPVASPLEEQTSLNKEGVDKVQEVAERAGNGDGSNLLEMQKIDGMKIPELKELARRQGIKGFSKLKKAELLQILKERLQAS